MSEISDRLVRQRVSADDGVNGVGASGSAWVTLKEIHGEINATIVAVADNCILRKRPR